MDHEKALAVFENFKIRRVYDEKTETWYFSVVDIIAALIQQPARLHRLEGDDEVLERP